MSRFSAETETYLDGQTTPDSEMAQLLASYDDGTSPDDPTESPREPAAGGQPDIEAPGGGNQPTPVAKEGSEGGGEQTLEQQLATLAGTYNVPVDQLSGFDSAEAAESALVDYVNQQAQLGRDYMRQSQYPQPDGQQFTGADDQFQQPPSYQQPQPFTPQQPAQLPDLDKALADLEEDHPLRGVLQQQQAFLGQMHQQYQQMQTAQQRAHEEMQRREMQLVQQQAVETLNGLSSERYGTAEQANMFQAQRREKTLLYAESLAYGYQFRGESIPNVKQLLEMADRVLFHKEIEQERLKSRAQARESQNGARLGRPGKSSSSPNSSNIDSQTPLDEQPELIRYYYELEQQGA